jgi:hypothetical protein
MIHKMMKIFTVNTCWKIKMEANLTKKHLWRTQRASYQPRSLTKSGGLVVGVFSIIKSKWMEPVKMKKILI